MLDLGRKAGGCEPVALSLGQIKIAVECILEPLSKIYEKKKKNTKGHTLTYHILSTPAKQDMESPCILLMCFPVLSVDIAYPH